MNITTEAGPSCEDVCALATKSHRCTAFRVDSLNTCRCGRLNLFASGPKTTENFFVSENCTQPVIAGINILSVRRNILRLANYFFLQFCTVCTLLLLMLQRMGFRPLSPPSLMSQNAKNPNGCQAKT